MQEQRRAKNVAQTGVGEPAGSEPVNCKGRGAQHCLHAGHREAAGGQAAVLSEVYLSRYKARTILLSSF